MARLQVLVVVGTRPEAIKLLPVIQALRNSELLAPLVVSTGQHREMVAEVLGLADITPDIELPPGGPNDSLNQLFGRVIVGVEQACEERFGPPDAFDQRLLHEPGRYPAGCVVHGDTTSAVAGALCAFHLQIPVAHVEAGLRTHLTRTPFPEELNRQLIARIATFHLAPTTTNAESLVLEGVHAEQIFVTGNTGIDAIRWVAGKHVPYGIPALDNLDERTRLVVVTAHRRENWGTGLIGIGTAVAALARANPDTVFVLPVHPNPVVGDTLRPLLERQHNVLLTPPLSYAPFARLLARAYLAISDSGGIQEEAPAVATPVLVTRDSTERREGLVAGTIRLVGTDPERIVAVTQRLLDDPDMHAAMVGAENPYGDGRAATRIVQAFEHLAFGTEPPLRFGAGFRRDALLRAAGFDIDLLTATRTAPGRGRLREPPEHHVLHNGAAQGRPAAGRPGAPG